MRRNGFYSLNKKTKSLLLALLSSALFYTTTASATDTAKMSNTAHSAESNTQAASELPNVRISALALEKQQGRILSIHPKDSDNVPSNCYRVKILGEQGKIHILDDICTG